MLGSSAIGHRAHRRFLLCRSAPGQPRCGQRRSDAGRGRPGAAQTPPPSAVAPTSAAAPRAHAAINPVERTRRAETVQRYYPSAELDKRSFPLADLSFPYPVVAGDERQGTLELTLYIGRDGVVDRVEVDFASVDQRLIDLATESLRATPFSPGERQGQAVGVRLRLAVDYALIAP